MNRRFLWFPVIALFFVCGCAAGPITPPMTALQIRSLQTREYPTRDTRMVMKALLNTLQDQGFVTRNSVFELGLITAVKETDMQSPSGEMWNSILNSDGTWVKQLMIEATANVTDVENSTRVRVSFKRKTLNNRGDVLEITEVLEPAFYQDFFSDVDKGIFLQKEGL